MRVVNNNKKYTCRYCHRAIETKRKVNWEHGQYYHISCLYEYAKRKMIEWRKVKNKLSPYKAEMCIEKLK